MSAKTHFAFIVGYNFTSFLLHAMTAVGHRGDVVVSDYVRIVEWKQKKTRNRYFLDVISVICTTDLAK